MIEDLWVDHPYAVAPKVGLNLLQSDAVDLRRTGATTRFAHPFSPLDLAICPYSASPNIFGRPSFTLRSMNAAIVNERLPRLDLALILRGVMIADALHVVSHVRWICDDIIVH